MFGYLKATIYILVFVFAGYTGYSFAVPQYKYYSFKTDAADIIKFNIKREEDIKAKLLQRALDLGIGISARDIIVERRDRGFFGRITWSETVDILGQYQKTYHFDVFVGRGAKEAEEGLGDGMGRGRKVFL